MLQQCFSKCNVHKDPRGLLLKGGLLFSRFGVGPQSLCFDKLPVNSMLLDHMRGNYSLKSLFLKVGYTLESARELLKNSPEILI